MKNPFASVSLSNILADFQKTIQRLDDLAMENNRKALEKRDAAEKANAEALALEAEAEQAIKTAVSIDRMLQG